MKKIIISLIIIILVIIFITSFGIFQAKYSGQHTGYVTSVEKSGVIFQTWTAYIKTDPQSSQEDTYCITNPNIITDLQNYEKERIPITIYYSAPVILWKWQCEKKASIINSVFIESQSTTTINK
jgi:uncharacterized protein YxeA